VGSGTGLPLTYYLPLAPLAPAAATHFKRESCLFAQLRLTDTVVTFDGMYNLAQAVALAGCFFPSKF
jgi:hypothetical protein